MSLTNPTDVVTEQRLKDFYDDIFPYLGGGADAGFTPVGTVISVMGTSAPANYLACNGQVVNIADYPELANYFYQQFGSKNKFGGNGTTTFGIPDLRGEFLRGAGTNGHANQGNGGSVGDHQDATYIPSVMCSGATIGWLKSSLDGDNNSVRDQDKNVTRTPTGIVSGQTQTITKYSATGGSMTTSATEAGQYYRPTNTSVLYCIATKNIYLNPSLDYSTDEKIVGTWIDGKPLYQKTVNITIDGTSMNLVSITNGVIRDYECIVNTDGSIWRKAPAFNNSGTMLYKVEVTASNILAYFSLSPIDYTGRTLIATIRYTKTTD